MSHIQLPERRCRGFNKHRERCKNPAAPTRWFCGHHRTQYASVAWKSFCALLGFAAAAITVWIGVRDYAFWLGPPVVLMPEKMELEFVDGSARRYPVLVRNRTDETRHDVWIALSLDGLHFPDLEVSCQGVEEALPPGMIRRVSINKLSLRRRDGTPVLAFRIPEIPGRSEVEVVVAASKSGTVSATLLDDTYELPREERVFGATLVEQMRINLPEDEMQLTGGEYAFVERVDARISRLLRTAQGELHRRRFTSAEEQYLAALETLTSLIEHRESFLKARLARALVQSLMAANYYHMQEFDQAERWLAAADLSFESLGRQERLELDADFAARPDTPWVRVDATVNRWSSLNHLLRVQIAGQRGDWMEVQRQSEVVERSLESIEDQDRFRVYLNSYIGLIATSQGRLDEALDRLRRNPRQAGTAHLAVIECTAWEGLSLALERDGRREEAIECVTRALQSGTTVLNTDQVQLLLVRRGLWNYERERWADCEQDLREVLFAPQSSGLMQRYAWLCWFRLGDCSYRMDRLEDAKEAFEMAMHCCRQLPRHLATETTYSALAASMNNVAWILVAQEEVRDDDIERAVTLVEAARPYLRLFGPSMRRTYHDTCEVVYRLAGDQEKAATARQLAKR